MEGVIENVLYFAGRTLEEAVSYAECVSKDPKEALDYIRSRNLEATHKVFRVVATVNLASGRQMKNAWSDEETEELSYRRGSGLSEPKHTGRGANRVGLGGGFCGGIGAGL